MNTALATEVGNAGIGSAVSMRTIYPPRRQNGGYAPFSPPIITKSGAAPYQNRNRIPYARADDGISVFFEECARRPGSA